MSSKRELASGARSEDVYTHRDVLRADVDVIVSDGRGDMVSITSPQSSGASGSHRLHDWGGITVPDGGTVAIQAVLNVWESVCSYSVFDSNVSY